MVVCHPNQYLPSMFLKMVNAAQSRRGEFGILDGAHAQERNNHV